MRWVLMPLNKQRFASFTVIATVLFHFVFGSRRVSYEIITIHVYSSRYSIWFPQNWFLILACIKTSRLIFEQAFNILWISKYEWYLRCWPLKLELRKFCWSKCFELIMRMFQEGDMDLSKLGGDLVCEVFESPSLTLITVS